MILAALSLAALTTVSLPVTTDDAQAQAIVDQGLFLYYAYDGTDAEGAFAAAAAREPSLSMAFWGEALADGPDLNTAISAVAFGRAQAAIRRAQTLEGGATPRERAFVDAMALRYAGSWDDRARDDAAYRKAMTEFATASHDANAELLAAEALLEHGDSRGALPFINNVLSTDPTNPMANHLCIHAYDAAADRAPAVACAQRLDAAVFPPQAEHLAHMPAHVWVETGAYALAATSSERAYQLLLQLDTLEHRGLSAQRYAQHDISLGYSAAMMLGDYRQAAVWSERMNSVFARNFDPLTALRFGRYADALAGAGTDESFDLPIRGLALLHANRLADARLTAALIRKQNGGEPTRGYLPQLFFARLAEAEGNNREARLWLTRAQENQKAEFFGEIIPSIPAQEALGGYLLRRTDFAAAVDAFENALNAYPNDPRVLFGLSAALTALGKTAEAEAARDRFDRLWAGADTTLTTADL
ncbi:MAG: tetratricopeptide repeat protein [Candidatus Eremiobacteraeota bacterium]|nr:tetratricopeptide repeat protein [Candidatus Eremiobacteraeota bacterium]